ncbi:HNH endonuclease [Vogesella indigofera]|uniref:HNH endonuclease n=1 Tax=Vogesella indigofera TaxID=45465 RepID=UPI00234E77AE|nr:HNH endonuclease [Vogesella indigofera]MDC7698335.1 HNH endonuclease [Vogesella indigofera]
MARKKSNAQINAEQNRKMLIKHYPDIGNSVKDWWFELFELENYNGQAGKKLHIERREQNELWLLVRDPAPGVYLVVAELRVSVEPVSLNLKCWIDVTHDDVYTKLSRAAPFSFQGRQWVKFPSEKAGDSWARDLESRGKQVRGVRFYCTLNELVQSPELLNSRVSEVTHDFLGYVLAVLADQPVLAEGLPKAWADSEESEPVVPSQDEIAWARFQAEAPTYRVALANARIGQGGYRQRMLQLWQGCCALTGLALPEALVASHARPWSKCENAYQCLDPYNGLLLAATFDRLFDQGLITFEQDGTLCVSPKLSAEQQQQLRLDAYPALRSALDVRHKPYLEYHRHKKFQIK